MKSRNHAFDLLCGLCILRMVMLHVVCQTHLRRAFWWRETMFWTFFFMSFFFFKAGYFNKGVTGKTSAYLHDRISRLLVPYISWGIIGAVLAFGWFCILPGGLDNALAMACKFRWWVGGLTFGNGPLWFLLSFFTTYVLMHFIEQVRHLHWVVLFFPLVGYWLFLHGNPLWFYLSNVFCGMFFFYLGKVWHQGLDRLSQTHALVLSILLCIGFVLANHFLHGEYEMHTNTWTGSFWQTMLIIVLSLTGLSGVLLSLPTPRIPLINYVGEHSMVYFVMHYPLVLCYVHASTLLGHNIHGSIPDLVVILLVTFTLCTLAVPYVERVPWLSGRKASSPKEESRLRLYFYHTQDTERIVREWKQGIFSSHFLYGALQLSDYGIDVVWHHQRHTYQRLHDMLVATWKVLTCRQSYDVLYATHSLGIEPIILLRALRLYRHPIVVWHHQPIVKAQNPLREALARVFYRGMDHMIFFSEKLMQDSLLSKKADPKRMSMVHWGADLEYYDRIVAQTHSDSKTHSDSQTPSNSPSMGRTEGEEETPSNSPSRGRTEGRWPFRLRLTEGKKGKPTSGEESLPIEGEVWRGSEEVLRGSWEALRGSEEVLRGSPCPFISTGKELRDYETLLQAFRETGLPLTLFVQKQRQAYFEPLLAKGGNIEVHYADRLIPHEIAQHVAQSRCVCICCQKSNYTVGLTTVVEALALGLPILCTRNPQMPMDIEAEGCGFWLEPNDVDGWKEKLRYIADHPEEAQAMGKRGRALAEKYYNVKQCGKEVAEIIKFRV